MKHLSLILVLMLLPAAMLAQERSVIDFPLDKLTGKWKMLTRKGLMMEEWERKDSTTFTGKSYLFKSGDTISLTILKLQITEGKVVYTTQSDSKSVSFALTISKNNSYTFENQSNGFPGKIHYEFTDAAMLHKCIEDDKAVPAKRLDFNYTRIEN